MHDADTVKHLETALEQNKQADSKAIIESVADKHDWLPLLKEAVAQNNKEIANGAHLPKLSIASVEQTRYPLTVYTVANSMDGSSEPVKELQLGDWHHGQPLVFTADELKAQGDQI